MGRRGERMGVRVGCMGVVKADVPFRLAGRVSERHGWRSV